MKDLRWPHVAVVLGAFGVLGTLAYFEKDAAAVITGVLALLGVMGFVAYQQSEIKQTTATIKDQTNGNIGQLMAMMEQTRQDLVASNDQHRRDMKEMADKMAMMTPPSDSPVPPAGEV